MQGAGATAPSRGRAKIQQNFMCDHKYFAFVQAVAIFCEYTKPRGGVASRLSDGENELVTTQIKTSLFLEISAFVSNFKVDLEKG